MDSYVYLTESIFASEIISLTYHSAALFMELNSSTSNEKLKSVIESSKSATEKHFKDIKSK
jgi:hypothetical protein